MAVRILASVIMLISLLFGPFWISIILALAAMVYFSYFWEAVILFFLADLLYGVEKTIFFEITIFPTLLSFLTLLIVEWAKKKIRVFS